ncbi:MAG: plasmid replication protein RepC, partial [Pseudomonadota bacterium]
MQRLTTTPFGRTVSAAVLETLERVEAGAPVSHIDKWEVFRQLCTARVALGVTDRDLTVLNALLSFHPGKVLGDNAPLIVFPSNRALAERAHGMAESTLRRHLAALVQAGLVLRHDSPNGKRFARRGAGGEVVRAFGFDLQPLLTRADEIAQAARAAEEAAERIR